MNNSYELIRFARIGGNMNAYLKEMYKKKKSHHHTKFHKKFIIAQ